jgi:hypothetical protein
VKDIHCTTSSSISFLFSTADTDYAPLNITISFTANNTFFNTNITLLDPDDTDNEEFRVRLIPLDEERDFLLDLELNIDHDTDRQARQASINVANVLRIKTGCEYYIVHTVITIPCDRDNEWVGGIPPSYNGPPLFEIHNSTQPIKVHFLIVAFAISFCMQS